MKTITIDGNAISDLDSFYDEVQRKFCPELISFGRNLDAFNDVLRGGFGVFEYGAPIKLVWINSAKSRIELTIFDEILDVIDDSEHGNRLKLVLE